LGLTLQMKQIKNPIKPKKPLLSKRDLVHVIEKARQQNLKLGTDFGIISYNETPLKKVVSNGITTISTDFTAMGKLLAQMVLTGKKEQIENKNALIIRNSL
jgi:DNA-binding LacI/PurR family transcriptional regulator